jgi:hypothetical protein
MATIYELAMLADLAYKDKAGAGTINVTNEDCHNASGWTVAGRLVAPGVNWATPVRAFAPPGFCTGVQAYFFTRNKGGKWETVLAIKGTKPQKSGDIVADIKIGLGIIPNQASAAKNFYKKYRDAYPNVTVVGHSLGGGLAQCLAYWYDLPFLTFNAPGMMGCLKEAAGNWTKPQVMARTSKAEKRHAASGTGPQGVNLRVQTDAVSRVSKTYGPQLMLPSTVNALSAHLMSTVLTGLRAAPELANITLDDLLAQQ